MSTSSRNTATERTVVGTIGARVRSARASRGWSLEELAARSGLSRRVIVNIEAAESNSTISTLLRLSDALGIGLPALVDDVPASVLKVTRSGHGAQLWTGARGGKATLVAGSAPPDVLELWDWWMPPEEQHTSEAHTPGTTELLLVLQGSIDLVVAEHNERLNAGDSVLFRGDVPHRYAASPDAVQVSRFVLSVFEPGVGGS
jgi:transcriptional regulator with XRE-family HTH domain